MNKKTFKTELSEHELWLLRTLLEREARKVKEMEQRAFNRMAAAEQSAKQFGENDPMALSRARKAERERLGLLEEQELLSRLAAECRELEGQN